MTTYLIQVGDHHINSTVALCAPGVELDDGGTYHLSRTQHWLWQCWEEFSAEVARLDGRKIVVFMGDLGELDTKRRSVQLITANKSTVLKTIQRTIEPLVEVADKLIIMRGTQAHVGKGAWLEETIASDYDHTIPDKQRGSASWYHMRPVIDNARFDLAHHASMSGLPWARGNSANNLAKKITWLYMVKMGQPAPHVALRAHNHIMTSSAQDEFPVFVQYGPAWTTATEYAYRAGHENSLSDVGGIIWKIDNGKFEKRAITFSPKESRKVWNLNI